MGKLTPLLTLAAVLLLVVGVMAMESDSYRLDWFTPATGSGGEADSANYASVFTAGQSVTGASSSASYEGCLGYWCATAPERRIYLPLVMRDS